jgi:hypothetical protein
VVELNSSGIFSGLDMSSQDKKPFIDEEKMKASAVEFKEKLSKSADETSLLLRSNASQVSPGNVGPSDKKVLSISVGGDSVKLTPLGVVDSSSNFNEVLQVDPGSQIDIHSLIEGDVYVENLDLVKDVSVELDNSSIINKTFDIEALVQVEPMKDSSDVVLGQLSQASGPTLFNSDLVKEISDLSMSVGEILSGVGIKVNRVEENSININKSLIPLKADEAMGHVSRDAGLSNMLPVVPEKSSGLVVGNGFSVNNLSSLPLSSVPLSSVPIMQKVELEVVTSGAFKFPNAKLFNTLEGKLIDVKVADFINSVKSSTIAKSSLLSLGVQQVSPIPEINSSIIEDQLAVVNSVDFKSSVEKQQEVSVLAQNSKDIKHKVLESRVSDLGVVIKKSIQEGITSLKINLSPSELGGIEVKVVDVNGDLTLRFKAEKPETLALLGQNEEALGDLLSSDSFGDKEFLFDGQRDGYLEEGATSEQGNETLVVSHDGLLNITV